LVCHAGGQGGTDLLQQSQIALGLRLERHDAGTEAVSESFEI
jgi:hypothetical protein